MTRALRCARASKAAVLPSLLRASCPPPLWGHPHGLGCSKLFLTILCRTRSLRDWGSHPTLDRKMKRPPQGPGDGEGGIYSRHPWRSPLRGRCAALARPKRLSCRFVEPDRFAIGVLIPHSTGKYKTRPIGGILYLAEREGFEPPVQLPGRWFSRPLHSTALPPLRNLHIVYFTPPHTIVLRRHWRSRPRKNTEKRPATPDRDAPCRPAYDRFGGIP